MSSHSVISPSSAHRWLACPGSVALTAGMPDTASKYADEGTAAHELAAAMLNGDAVLPQIDDPDMVRAVESYVEAVKAAAQGGVLYVEQKVDLSEVLGIPDTFGTTDAVILHDNELQIWDLKTGRGVKVDAVENEQLMLYAVGAYSEFHLAGSFKQVRLFIHQPRIFHVDEWVISVGDLLRWGVETQKKAKHAMAQLDPGVDVDLQPGEKQCRFCRAKATCPALSKFVQNETALAFDNLEEQLAAAPPTPPKDLLSDTLALHLEAVDLVEGWCKAVREEAFRRLAEGIDVPGYKLVEGRRGARAWASKDEAEGALKAMRLKVEEMYDLSLISPTTAEKLFKAGTIGPRQWPKLQGLITQPAGKPSVAPADDKRPAITIAAQPSDFEDLTAA